MKQWKQVCRALFAGMLGISLFASGVSAAELRLAPETAADTTGGISINSDHISKSRYKNTALNNPISPDFFCADPTAVEYEGRLYLFGTNDHEQYEKIGPDQDNSYEQIKSFLIFSTDDMVNWTYNGKINVGSIAPWIMNAWAPSICSRVEADGKTHFYLYFSNNGVGVGVLTATDPLGPWTDPLGKPLVSTSTAGLTNCPNPFDPGVVIDDNGVGWLSFGAGQAQGADSYHKGATRIVKLGDDMISFASDFKEIPTAYAMEASELNYINGTYVYTYCNDWIDSSKVAWDYDCEVATQCSMVYMTTKTPLDPQSWKMGGTYFINPGEAGFDYSNNHTHLHKFKDRWYLFYHTLELKKGMGITGAYRSMAVDEIEVDETAVTIKKCGGTKKGPQMIAPVDPFAVQPAGALCSNADITYDMTDPAAPCVVAKKAGAWQSVRGVQFTESANAGTAAPEPEMTASAIDLLTYHITVTAVDGDTEITMNPSDSKGNDCSGCVSVKGTGKYTIECDLGGAEGLNNLGYFTAKGDTKITFLVDSITVNGEYEILVGAELTNTREWADGLRNIWNGFADGDVVYGSDNAEFRYIKADDAIAFFADPNIADAADSDAPLVDVPVTFVAAVKGKGCIEVRLDAPNGRLLTSIAFDSSNAYTAVKNTEVASVGGTHDLYFVYSAADVSMKAWTFAKESASAGRLLGDANANGTVTLSDAVMLQKYLLKLGDVISPENADCNADGKLTAVDLSLLKAMLF